MLFVNIGDMNKDSEPVLWCDINLASKAVEVSYSLESECVVIRKVKGVLYIRSMIDRVYCWFLI